MTPAHKPGFRRSYRYFLRIGLCLCLRGLAPAGPAPEGAAEKLPNGGFENGLDGWSGFWSRDAGAGSATLDTRSAHGGKQAVRLEHRGDRDWSFPSQARLRVATGQIYELSGWVRTDGPGEVVLSVITTDQDGKTVDWSYCGSLAPAKADWRLLRSRFVVPDGVVFIQPRWMGSGSTTAWVDDVSLRACGTLEDLRATDLPGEAKLANASLEVVVHTGDGTFTVKDKRTGRSWHQKNITPQCVVTRAEPVAGGLRLALHHIESGQTLAATVRLEGDLPELTVALSGAATFTFSSPIRFPHPFVTEPGTHLVVPLNEGISYPVDESDIPTLRLVAYGGHGICMAFWGVTDGTRGQMAILETPDDATIDIARSAGLLHVAPGWDPQHGRLGYDRRIRYVFLDHGGHVAIAKRYRAHAIRNGLFKTLAQKREENPNTDLLLGAANVWSWEKDAPALVKEMQSAGIGRILWSGGGSPETIRALNAMPGVLTSRYDIYQDVMDPANFPSLGGVHGDWVTEAWPQDIIRTTSGDWLRGWAVRGTKGDWYSCGVICDRQALPYARHRIAADLAARPFRARFIDTTTAAPWHECYHPDHPMTRSQSREWKMKLLELVSSGHHLVTGCETGHDAAVPYLHYFEGMLSLGPFRVPDSGRDTARIWTEVPERVARFQLGHRYRLPLWELVFHECVVAQWYWGDYNNKLPALWDKRDLFNVLYATPPMFMFNRELWQQERERFVRSYRTTCPVARAVACAEMTDHRFLDATRDVQQTVFANGVTVTVNFGGQPHRLPDGTALAPLGVIVSGM